MAGCSAEVTGPTPDVVDPTAGTALPVDPGVICREQLTTPVVVHGDRFSPIPFDIPNDPKAALPTLTLIRAHELDGMDGDAVEYTWSGHPEGVNAARLSWQSQAQMTFVVDQSLDLPDGSAGMLAAGLYDLKVTNANGNEATSVTTLGVIDRPTLSEVDPSITCLAQGPRTLGLTGESFLRLDGSDAVFAVEGVTAPFAMTDFGGCTDIPHPGVEATLCTSANAPLAQDSIPVGYPAVTVENPETAACVSEDDKRLRVVPPPEITRFDPPMVCVAQGDRDVVLIGAELLGIDDGIPAVTLDGGAITSGPLASCEDLPTQDHDVSRCTALTITVPAEDTTAPRTPAIGVTNPEPAGCEDSRSDQLVLVPPPTIDDVAPPVICADGADQVLRLSGSYFFTVDGAPPSVTVDAATVDASAITPGACQNLTVPGLTVQDCDQLDVVVSPSMVDGDSATIAVTNPGPAGCSDTYDIEVPLIDPPSITSAEPALVCTDDGDRSVVIKGAAFYVVGTVRPSVTLNGVDAPVTATGGCVAGAIGPLTDVQTCTELTVSVAQSALDPGPVTIAVTSAPPIPCSTTSAEVLVAPPDVVVTEVVPDAVCTAAGDATVTIKGDGFLVVDGVGPAVTLADTPYAILAGTLAGCTDLAVPGMTASSCTELAVLVPGGALPEGDVAVGITNPAPSGCATTATGVFFSVPVPVLTDVAPTEFCTDTGDVLTLTGSNFSPASRVYLSGTNGSTYEASVSFVSATTIEATFAPNIPAGTYDITLENAAGCDDTLPGAVKVHPTPLVFFVDPPVVYNGITIQATIYLSGLDQPAAEVVMVGPSGQEQILDGSSPDGSLTRIQALIPSGLEPGSWAVRITSQIGCVGVLDGAVTVTNDLSVTIDDVDPGYVWSGASTAITVTSDAGDFVQTPRAYLNPQSATEGTPATNVRAVLWADPTTLTGVVPGEQLQAGERYDLIVVNPDGTVGLYDGVVVTADPPPRIDTIVPASFDANAPFPATLVGSSFDADTVTMRCLVPTGNGTFTVYPANDQPGLAATITSASDVSVAATFPADDANLAPGSVCTVTITNVDGSSFRYSAVSLKNPSQNLNAWRDTGESMAEARRGLGLVAGRPTNTSRFLYAVGGDAGTLADAKSSVEAAGVDVFGRLGGWSGQRHSLPSPRTFAGTVRLGRFVYTVGGDDGTAAVASVYRAEVLDPLATPELDDLDITIDDTLAATTGPKGMGAGVWIYRIAAVFPADDPNNAGGESLPGEPIVVQLPDLPGLVVTIRWDAIPGASGYRIYRTPEAGQGVDAVRLVGTTDGHDATSFPDKGIDAGADAPLPAGSLGVWQSLSTQLQVAREAHALVAAPHPTQDGVYFLYAAGGMVPDGVSAGVDRYLDDYEVARIDVTPAAEAKGRETQAMSAWTQHTGQLQTARAWLGAYVVKGGDVTEPGGAFGGTRGEVWVFFGPGRASGGAEAAMDVGVVKADGSLGYPADDPATGGDPPLMEPGQNPPAVFGYGPGVANGFLFISGGGSNATSPDNRVRSAEMCVGAGDCGGVDRLPELRNWTPQGGGVLTAARIFLGVTQESAFFFSAGGVGPAAAGGLEVKSDVGTTVQ
ncbi:MAG: hypothetical protein EP329_19425 [Deltaproteobacteria bacterium]|nr:MAG: hypothetical protein EP329_19425 [Deltaproteobacteria bacterium]